MKSLAVIFACAVLLSGCSDGDWARMTTFGDKNTDDAAIYPDAAPQSQAVAPAASAAAPANEGFCQAVAQQDATSNGFDAATQRSVYARSYAQCTAIYTR
jgi:PBP1b-binding outer membrane lipoprotein LpoB